MRVAGRISKAEGVAVARAWCAAALCTALAVAQASSSRADLPRTLELDPTKSRVEYHIDHPVSAVTDVAGTPAGRLVSEAEGGAPRLHGSIRVDLGALQTGISMRDRHIKSAEYLDVEKYPLAEFRLDSLVAASPSGAPPRLPKDGTAPSWTGLACGELTFHGILRPVRVPVALWWLASPGGDGLRVVGDFTIAFADYQM